VRGPSAIVAPATVPAPRRGVFAASRWWVVLLLALSLAAGAGCSSAAAERQKREKKADFHYKLALGYFHARNIDLAIRELVRSFDFDADNADSRYLSGFILFGRKRYEEAAANFRHALTRRPRFFAARNHLGVTYLELERYHEAIETLEPLLKEPTYTTPYLPHNNIGWAYLKQGDLRNAEKHLRMAIFLNPKFCLGHRNLGLLAMERRDFRAAVEHLEVATGRCPRFAAAWMQLAEALIAVGPPRSNEAQDAFKRCYVLEGDTMVGRRCRARIVGPLPNREPRNRDNDTVAPGTGGWQQTPNDWQGGTR
jgi:Tfp pilus assembly protein PilF